MKIVQNGKSFAVGFLFAITLIGCAGVTFPYKWFYPDLKSYEGILIGDRPSNDLDASECIKGSSGEHGCVVMLKPEFKAMYNEYLDMKQKIITLERNCQQ